MTDFKEFDLKAETELRIELSGNDDQTYEVVTVQLVSGSAEVFGVPLAAEKGYSWGQGDKLAIFTWYGCKLRLFGSLKDSMIYVSDETPMLSFVNTHAQLEARRDHAAAVLNRANEEGNLDGGKYKSVDDATGKPKPLAMGPRVLVCGPVDSGKSALCGYLAACAVRVGRSPLLVELDPSMVR
jgi:polyribonucleotide 5'-hydroxyl-kinase